MSHSHLLLIILSVVAMLFPLVTMMTAMIQARFARVGLGLLGFVLIMVDMVIMRAYPTFIPLGVHLVVLIVVPVLYSAPLLGCLHLTPGIALLAYTPWGARFIDQRPHLLEPYDELAYRGPHDNAARYARSLSTLVRLGRAGSTAAVQALRTLMAKSDQDEVAFAWLHLFRDHVDELVDMGLRHDVSAAVRARSWELLAKITGAPEPT